MQRIVSNARAHGELYVVQTRHCIHTQLPVFNVGRSEDADRRLSQYPKGTVMLARLPVSRMVESEALMLALCRSTFIERKDFGPEFFEGDLYKVVGLLAMVVAMYPYHRKYVTAINDEARYI